MTERLPRLRKHLIGILEKRERDGKREREKERDTPRNDTTKCFFAHLEECEIYEHEHNLQYILHGRRSRKIKLRRSFGVLPLNYRLVRESGRIFVVTHRDIAAARQSTRVNELAPPSLRIANENTRVGKILVLIKGKFIKVENLQRALGNIRERRAGLMLLTFQGKLSNVEGT